MRLLANASCLLAIVVATMPSHSTVRQPEPFDIALDNGDLVGAAKEIEKLTGQRRARAGGDDRLDAYYGRFFATAAQGSIAEPYLLRAIAAAGNSADRDELALELARAREVDGFVDKAEMDYRQLSTRATDPAVKNDAILALARLRLGAAPDEAAGLLAPLINGGSLAVRWEAHLLLSRAFSIAGRSADSDAALAAAWQEAPQAAVPANAIAVTSMDMALNRAAANDRHGEIGLISIGQSDSRFAGVAQLPVCNDRLHPEDSVTVAIAADQWQRPLYSAVRASRPGIAQLFTVPLAVAQQRIAGSAIYVTLRCRIAPDAYVRFAGGRMRNVLSWLAEKNFFPPLRLIDPQAGDPLTQLKTQVRELEAAAGTENPMLVPLLLQLSLLQGMQSRFNNAESFAEAKSIAGRALAILTKAGAPSEVIEQVRVQTTLAFAQNENLADVAGPAALEAMEAMASRPDTSPTQAYAAFDEMSGWRLRPTQLLALSDRLVTFFDVRSVPPRDPIRQAIELRRADILRKIGTLAGMKDRLEANGVAADLCAGADRPPSIPPTAITLTSEDYPKDLLRRSVTGLTTIELSVDADGRIATQRILASQPASLFDAVTEDKLKAVTLLPAQRDNKPIACRGKIQTVRWQIPFQGDFSSPFEGLVPQSDD